ncbi:hypothetical protein QQF64_029476 [Cirrhinus molitorella]|uniref:Pyrin domain-containing protein n=1 Tax=Cirrhinus molitorella TaxID=172907 RepID=A0ABR3N0X2_9TELE
MTEILNVLEELDSEEMDLFQWHLTQGISNFKIPKSQLEKKPRHAVVDCMTQRYPDDARKLTMLILEKMNKINLVKCLQEELGENKETVQSKHTAEAAAAQKQRSKAGAEFVEKHRTELINGVSLVEPIADDMKPLIGDEKTESPKT